MLSGLDGNDTLNGGAGADDMTGGNGNDIFLYKAITESGPAAAGRDKINGFVHGEDKINVHIIDANTGVAGNQDFTTGDFLAGQFMVTQAGGDTLVSFNVDGDAAAEMVIVLKGYLGTFDATDLIA